jgi:hypothetical protein
MVVILFITGVITFGVPATVAVLVSLASKGEDSAWSLNGPPQSGLQAAARRVVGFHGPVRQPASIPLTGAHERISEYDDVLSASRVGRSWPVLASR